MMKGESSDMPRPITDIAFTAKEVDRFDFQFHSTFFMIARFTNLATFFNNGFPTIFANMYNILGTFWAKGFAF